MNREKDFRDKGVKKDQLCNDVLVSLRKIIQAIDMHSRTLSKQYGLTGPQLVILQELSRKQGCSVTELSRAISLSQGTVTMIISRLEKNGLVTKKKSLSDKRRTEIDITEKCHKLLQKAPTPLQETFMNEFYELEEWEQLMILSSLKRIVEMMAVKEIDASPFLTSGPIPGPKNDEA